MAHTFVALIVAFVLGTAIGFERQWRQRNAGLRTTVLVAIGAAAFSDLGLQLTGGEGAVRVVAYVVSGIGFLGAGVILKDGGTIRGLNTAATLWCAAAVGSFAGAGFAGEAVLLTLLVLAGNTLLRPLVDWVNRRPIASRTTEARYRVLATCARPEIAAVRDLLDEVLSAADYPVRDVIVSTGGDAEVELVAELIPTSADAGELDAAVARIEASPIVRAATWSVGAVA